MLKLLGVGLLGLFLFLVWFATYDGTPRRPAPTKAPTPVPAKSVPAQKGAQAERAAEARSQAGEKQEVVISPRQVELMRKAEQRQADLRKAKRLQPGRKQLIQKLISLGIFSKVEMPGSLPHVWITPTFRRLDFDDKQKFLNVVYAYYLTENRRSNIVVLKDSRTGKRIGTYSQSGLDLD